MTSCVLAIVNSVFQSMLQAERRFVAIVTEAPVTVDSPYQMILRIGQLGEMILNMNQLLQTSLSRQKELHPKNNWF